MRVVEEEAARVRGFWTILALLFLAALVIVFGYRVFQTFDLEEHARYTDALDKLGVADRSVLAAAGTAVISEAIVPARFDLMPMRIEALQTDLEKYPTYLSPADRNALDGLLAEHKRAVNKLIALFARYKAVARRLRGAAGAPDPGAWSERLAVIDAISAVRPDRILERLHARYDLAFTRAARKMEWYRNLGAALMLGLVGVSCFTLLRLRASMRTLEVLNARLDKLLHERTAEASDQHQVAQRACSQLETALDASDEAILLLTADGAVRMANDRTWSLFALEPSAIVGGTVRGLWPRVEATFENPESLAGLARLCRAQPHSSHSVALMQKWPQARDIRAVANPIRSSDGEVSGWLTVFRDETSERQVDRMKDEFISLVSHELRTPLTSIRGALGLISGGVFGNMNAEGQHAAAIAVRNTDRLIRLLNDILDLERLETGRIPLALGPSDLPEIVADAVDAMQPMAGAAGVELVVGPVQACLQADPDRLVQLLTNLISNAIKFSKRGGRVWVDAVEVDLAYRISVRDEGRGIPSDKLDHVFGRFHQVDASDSRDKGGTGLGLAICRSIAALHGGRIWVESEFGVGSTFHFTVPTADRSDPAGQVATVEG